MLAHCTSLMALVPLSVNRSINTCRNSLQEAQYGHTQLMLCSCASVAMTLLILMLLDGHRAAGQTATVSVAYTDYGEMQQDNQNPEDGEQLTYHNIPDHCAGKTHCILPPSVDAPSQGGVAE